MLGNLFKKKELKSDEQIRADKQKWLDELLVRSAKLQKLVKANDTGWKEYVALIDDYIDKCKRRKVVTALDIADDKTIYELKLIDHEVFILTWLKKMPAQFIGNVEKKIEQEAKKEEDAPTD